MFKKKEWDIRRAKGLLGFQGLRYMELVITTKSVRGKTELILTLISIYSEVSQVTSSLEIFGSEFSRHIKFPMRVTPRANYLITLTVLSEKCKLRSSLLCPPGLLLSPFLAVFSAMELGLGTRAILHVTSVWNFTEFLIPGGWNELGA
jgi:hypothetical protein